MELRGLGRILAVPVIVLGIIPEQGCAQPIKKVGNYSFIGMYKPAYAPYFDPSIDSEWDNTLRDFQIVHYDGGKPGQADDLKVEIYTFSSGEGLKERVERFGKASFAQNLDLKQGKVILSEIPSGKFALWVNRNKIFAAHTEKGELDRRMLEILTSLK